MSEIVLVVAAHPDDEVLGCGGTIAVHASRGDEVHVLIMAEGVTSREDTRDRDAKARELSDLARRAHRAGEILGTASVTLHDLPDNRMDSVDLLDIVKVVEKRIETVHPSVVYTHHGGDLNIDHQRTSQAVVTACRPLPGGSVSQLLFFEVPSSTEWTPGGTSPPFVPTCFMDISAMLERKLEALKSYDSEMRDWPHPRSYRAVEHLARWRGASVALDAAEAFMVGRIIR